MFAFLKKFSRDDSGATAIEYGLIAALVAVAIIGGLQLVGGSLSGAFTSIGNEINTAVGAGGAGGGG